MNTRSSGKSTSSLGSRKSKPCENASNAVQRVSAAASNPFTLGDAGEVAVPPPDDPASKARQLLNSSYLGTRTDREQLESPSYALGHVVHLVRSQEPVRVHSPRLQMATRGNDGPEQVPSARRSWPSDSAILSSVRLPPAFRKQYPPHRPPP